MYKRRFHGLSLLGLSMPSFCFDNDINYGKQIKEETIKKSLAGYKHKRVSTNRKNFSPEELLVLSSLSGKDKKKYIKALKEKYHV